MKGLTCCTFVLALMAAPPIHAQTQPRQLVQAAGEPAAKPPAKKSDKQAGSPAQAAGQDPAGVLAATPGGDQVPKPVYDAAKLHFVEEHAVCAAYFHIADKCLRADDPDKVPAIERAKTLMNRALWYEKELSLQTGSMAARGEAAQKTMLDHLWQCSNFSSLADYRIPCIALVEEPETRLKLHIVEQTKRLANESSGPPLQNRPNQ